MNHDEYKVNSWGIIWGGRAVAWDSIVALGIVGNEALRLHLSNGTDRDIKSLAPDVLLEMLFTRLGERVSGKAIKT